MQSVFIYFCTNNTPDTSTVVKVTFKNIKTKKSTTLKYRCVVKAAKEDEPVVDILSITSLKATSADTLTATFASAVDTADVAIKVTKSGSTTAITGTTTWDDAKTTATFKAAAKFTAGTYELTATSAADATKTTSATATVENEKVAEIVITNDVALTNADKTEAYIYYDVLNQYGESIKASTTINWTVSTATTPKINKATGKITARKNDNNETYTYGSSIFVTGVYTKTGVNVQKELTIGMEQVLDTVRTAGFVKKSDKNTILSGLPVNFQQGEYVMLYQTFDQNGNQLDAVGIADGNITAGNVTFICDNPLLMKSDFKDDELYTIDGEEYCSVAIEPGQYVDKGGEVNITAISNKTGNKTIMNYVIGAGGILKKLVLSQPSTVVADGETGVELPYVAYDIDGNEITNYETIARSTNTLSLTASDNSTLTVKENDDGTAKVVWSDKPVEWTDPTTWDEVDRSVALTTVVVGGESDNLLLQVSDKARPVAVSKVTFRDGYSNAIVGYDSDTVSLSDMTYVDQYGRTMDTPDAVEFLTLKSWHNSYYGVKAIFNKTDSNFTFDTDPTVNGAILLNKADSNFVWNANEVDEVKNETVKYSVVSIETKNATPETTADDYDDCSKKLNVSYSVVPMKSVTNIALNSLDKQYISLGLEDYKTGAEAGYEATELTTTLKADTTITNVEIKPNYEQTIKVSGAYKGTKVYVPTTYVQVSSDKFDIDSDNTINTKAVSQAAITVGDFFDAKAANFARKDGSAKIEAVVYSVTNGAISVMTDVEKKAAQMGNPTTTLAFSDEAPAPAKIILPETATVHASNTNLWEGALYDHTLDGEKYKADAPAVKDQYNKSLSDITFKYTISDIVENEKEFAHLDNSFAVSGNSTNDPKLTGVELGDTFTLTYDASNKYGSATGSVKITVGADMWARVTTDSNFANSNDEKLRETLKYAY